MHIVWAGGVMVLGRWKMIRVRLRASERAEGPTRSDECALCVQRGVRRAFDYDELSAYEFAGSKKHREATMERSAKAWTDVLRDVGIRVESWRWVRARLSKLQAEELPGGPLPRSEIGQSSKVFDYPTIAKALRAAGLERLLHAESRLELG